MKTDKATIKIPRPLYNNLKIVIENSGFDSVTDFIVYVLRDIASSPGLPGPDQVWGPRDIKKIKDKLRRLGYL